MNAGRAPGAHHPGAPTAEVYYSHGTRHVVPHTAASPEPIGINVYPTIDLSDNHFTLRQKNL